MSWFSGYGVFCIECVSHLYSMRRQTVGQLVSTSSTMNLHLQQGPQCMSGSPNMASSLRSLFPLAREVREWKMKWHMHVSVCSLMTLSLSRLSLSASGLISVQFIPLLHIRFSVALPTNTCLAPIIEGNRAKMAAGVCTETLFRSAGSQTGCGGFSLPHLASQRFKWRELPSFSYKKTFWPAFCKFSELSLNED